MDRLGAKHFITSLSLDRESVPSFNSYPFCLPACRNLESLELHPEATFFVGENGTGKSTLLEAVATEWGFNPEGGTVNFNFSTRASHSSLHEFLTLIKGFRRPKDGFFLRAESFHNVATEIERLGVEGSYGGRSLHEQSHGEAFLSLAMNRFGGDGLYILDEPEAALSPNRQLAFLARIQQLAKDGSQFIIATHSPLLMAYPNAFIYQFSEEGVKRVAYKETDHYIVAREFLNKPEAMLKELFSEAK